MTQLRLDLLGGFAASLADGSPCLLPTRKSQALLAYLAVTAGRLHSRDKLTALLWGDTGEQRARQSFRQALSSLRRAVGPAAETVLLTQSDSIGLNPAAVAVDVGILENAATDGSIARLEQAATLYKGEFLDGFRVEEPEFEEWHRVERERLHAVALQILSRLLDLQAGEERPEAAVQTALRLLALDPTQEAVHRQLMRLLLRQGRRAAALKQYQALTDWLARELGAEPEEESRQLYRDILQASTAVREEPHQSPFGAVTPLEDAPLLGRDSELERLQQALQQLQAGTGQLLLLKGEAGIGKTRLLRHFGAVAAGAGAKVLLGRCHETEQVLPLQAWIDLLRGDRTALDPGIRAQLGAAAGQLVRMFPELLGSGEEPITVVEQPGLLFDALALLIGEIATAQPLVLMLEDLHWADGLSARFLAFLGRRLRRLPVLVVGTMRPEEMLDAPILAQAVQELRSDGALAELVLGPLPQADGLRLAELLQPAGRDQSQRARIAAEIWTASAGSPFIIVESIRAMHGRRAAAGALPLAGSIRELVTRRLDRLAPLPRRILRVGAAIGRDFSFALLVRAAAVSEAAAADALEELVRRQFLAAEGDRLDFRHDWIRRVAYDSLLGPRRALLHAAIGAALESLHHNSPDEIADQLGHHFARAGNATKAIQWLIRFHQLAARRYALDDALRALRQAIAVAADLPPPERDRHTLDLVLRQAFVMSIQGRQREIMQMLLGETDRLQRVSDPSTISEYHSRLGLTCFFLGNRSLGQQAAERGLVEGERAGNPECIGKALHVLSLNAFEGGRPREGIAHARRAIPLFDRPHNRQWLGLVYHDLALNSVTAGELDAALEAAEQADRLARSGEWARVRVLAGYATAWALALRGDTTEAIAVVQERLALSRDPMASGLVSGALGLALTEQGDAKAAVPILVEVVAQLQKHPVRSGEARHLAFLSEAYLGAGDLAEAEAAAARVMALGETDPMPFNVGLAERALGRIALGRGDLAAARRWLEQSLGTFESCDAVFEAARVRLDLAGIAARDGAVEKATELLSAARQAFHAANAPTRVDTADRLAGSLGLAAAGTWSRSPPGAV